MEFEFTENKAALAKIKVVGIGGAGNNAINNMIASGLEGVAFIAANTDLQDLESCAASNKIQLGAKLTKGLGCGAKPEVGREAAVESLEEIRRLLGDSDMVFLTAGMGGGTGTGGAPVFAQVLKELEDPPLTVAVVTKPFKFEGPRRLNQAEEGIGRLKEFVDTIITVPNDRLLAMAPKGCSVKQAFKMADDVLLHAVKGVSDLILLRGHINLDFEDAQTVMSNKGQALMGTGQASGPDRAIVAAQQAISSPLLEDISITGAQGILINIAAAEDNVSLEEINEACSLIQAEAHPDADVIFGVAWDDSLGDDLRITVIATGIGKKEEPKIIHKLKERARLASFEEVAARHDVYEQPTYTRRNPDRRGQERRVESSLSQFEKPGYSKYENFTVAEEDLEKPTFMRRKAD
ncbi:MAG: cell division protein FtsZ [Thermodesulfobacteriota bacterium]